MKLVKSPLLNTGHLYPQEFFWYSFVEAESTTGHMIPSVASEKILSDTTGDRFRDPPASSLSALTTTLPQAPISDSISLNYSRMRNVLDKSCGENQNTLFVCNFLFPEIAPLMR